MRCSRCHVVLPAGAAFCPDCGLPVSPQAQPAPPPSGWVPAGPARFAPAPPPPPPPSPRPRRTGLVIGIVAAVLVLAIAGGVAAVLLLRPRTTTATPPVAPTTEVPLPEATTARAEPAQPTPEWSPTPSPTPDADEVAAATLRERSGRDAASVAFEGQWVAQLASKYVGVRDPYQTAANGTHTFYAADILAESDALASRVSGARVVLLDSTTYGKHFSHDGEPLWVTMALSPGFASKDDVLAWCAGQFPELSGKALTNQCMPNRLNP